MGCVQSPVVSPCARQGGLQTDADRVVFDSVVHVNIRVRIGFRFVGVAYARCFLSER